jgi:hypothetical protein
MENWSWYNRAFFPISYRQFKNQMRSFLPDVRVIRMNPGISVEVQADQIFWKDPLSWILPVGDQDVDYIYDPQMEPQSTEEIAQQFEALNADETKIVLEYCEKGLMEQYHKLEMPENSYFDKPRIWRLALVDSQGKTQFFFYQVHQNKIRLSDSTEASIGWTTEVPMTRMFGALKNGESLTSMYIRVNNENFDAEVEREIQEADIMEDPLIRCLFTGVFGAYQRAQLHQIQCRNARAASTSK